MTNQVDIKVKTVVDSSDLDNLKKKISDSSENVKIGVDTDAKSSIDKLKEIQKKAKEIDAEKTLVNIEVATKGLQEIEKIKSEYEELKNMLPPNLRIEMDTTAEDRIDEIRKKINDLDGLSPQIKTMIDDGAIDELQAIQTATDNLDGLSPKIKPTVDDSEAIASLQNIQNQAEGMGGLEQGLAGILGTMGVSQLLGTGVETATNMDKAWRNWVGGLQQSGMSFDNAKKKADGFYKTVNNLASTGQSSDSLFKNVAGLVINLNNKVTDSTLGMTEKVVAGYEMLGGRTGATMYEMEKELKNFLSTGDLGLMEDTLSSLKDPEKWKGLLEGAGTVEERIKILNDMLSEEGIMGALNIDAPSKSIDQLKAMFDATMTSIGTAIIGIVKPIADGLMWLDKATGGVSTSILSFTAVIGLGAVAVIGLVGTFGMLASSFKTTISGFSSFSSLFGSLGQSTALVKHTAELGANTAALASNTAALEANNIARATSGGADAAAKGLSQISTVGSAAGSAAPGAAAGATGFAAISSSITSMLVPLLAISAVIAIMIPIIAGLAIEVLLFVRIIGEVVQALRFDKLNLGPAIEGIKQIGLAMWELGRAFAALTLVNMVGLVYTATGGILGTGLALGQFWLATKGIEVILKYIDKLNINMSVVAKITMLKEVLNGMSVAMLGMAGLNITGVITWLTGGVGAVKTNIKNIVEIGKAIQDTTIPTVDNSKVDSIKKLAEVIKSLSIASQAVDDATGWFQTKVLNQDDVEGMKATLRSLTDIALAINSASIPTVGKDKVDLVNALANVVKPLAEASKAVDEANGMFQMSVLNQDDVEGMKATLRSLSDIANAINGASIPAVDKTKIDAVRNIKNVIMPLVESAKAINDNYQSILITPTMAEPFKMAIRSLYSINQELNNTAFSVDSTKIQAISNLKLIVQKVGEIGLFISNNTGNIGTYIQDNTPDIKGALSSLYSINQHINSLAFGMDPAKSEALGLLKAPIERVNEIGIIINQNLANFVALAQNKQTVIDAISAIEEINNKLKNTPLEIDESKTAAIASLNSLIQLIISTLNSATGVKSAAQNMGSQITTGFKAGAKNLGPASVTVVANAINAVKNRYDTMRSAGNVLGAALASGFKSGAGISSPMAVVVSGMSDTLAHINSLTSDFESAGHALGSTVQDSYRAQHKSTTEAGYSKLINEVRGDVVNLFNNTGFRWGGGSVSAAGGEIISAAGGDTSDFKIEYPSKNEYHYHLESLIVDQNSIDKFGELQKKHKQQENMRV